MTGLPQVKRCNRCKLVKDISDFHNSKSSGDGRTWRCKKCAVIAASEWAKNNPERRAKISSDWRKNNQQKIKAYYEKNAADSIERVKKWRIDNPEKFAAHGPTRSAYMAKWKAANKASIEAWNEENKWSMRSRVAKRRARRKQATPEWADTNKIQAYYIGADALNMLTGEWHHVDHIVPLQSDMVCGLHNHFNLQILTAADNRLKSNRYWPDKP